MPSPSAFDAAVRLLKGRAKSRMGLEHGLLQRGFAPDAVAAAIARVTELGYLDDGRLAEARARAAIAEGRPPADVERRLLGLGIDEATAKAATARAVDEAGYDALKAAEAWLRRKNLVGAKAARALLARGFDDDVIEALLGNRDPEIP